MKIKVDAWSQNFDANRRPLHITGEVVLFVRVGGSWLKAAFFVCRSLFVLILVVTAFLKQYVRRILPMDHQLPIKKEDEELILESDANGDIVKDKSEFTVSQVGIGSPSERIVRPSCYLQSVQRMNSIFGPDGFPSIGEAARAMCVHQEYCY